MTDTANATKMTEVAAEEAPIGVQLWPATHPKYAPSFTLAAVSILTRIARSATGTSEYTYVEWLYQSGETRRFNLGERVIIQLP